MTRQKKPKFSPALPNLLSSDSSLIQISEDLPNYVVMGMCLSQGITPEMLAQFIEAAHTSGCDQDSFPTILDLIDGMATFMPNFDGMESTNEPRQRRHRRVGAPKYRHEPLPAEEAAGLTYELKVQVKDINKPPMWREIKVSANISMKQLADIVFTLFGWTPAETYTVTPTPASSECVVGPEEIDPTFVASQTPLTAFLQKNTDKIFLAFGENKCWMCEIRLMSIANAPCAHPEMTAQKGGSPSNSIDTPAHLEYFRILAVKKSRLNLQERKYLTNAGFKSQSDLRHAIVADTDMAAVNARLARL